MSYDVSALLRRADVLLIVPPFAWQDRPSLGLHLLQGIARRAGFEAQVLYTNLLFSAYFDEGTHTTISRIQHGLFLGERLFARAAFDTPALGRDGGAGLEPRFEVLRLAHERRGLPFPIDIKAVLRLEERIAGWLGSFAPAITAADYSVVGATTSFEQNAAALAILRSVKLARPETVTILGGANCEGEMAEGVASLTSTVDHVFSGESEQTFLDFLTSRRDRQVIERILYGKPCMELDELPIPDYSDYYAQLNALMPASLLVTRGCACLTYETSRGCWWGAKSHCTFCGLNGQGMASREKSPDRVIEELRVLLADHPTTDARGLQMGVNGTLQGNRDRPTKLVTLTDNIMPHGYFRTLLPRLAEEFPNLTMMYEQKANLSLRQVRGLVDSGITEIQPGIEALSTGLLKLMRKGTTAAQNVALLRYARCTNLYLYWNLLYAFPNDEVSFYEETLELLPLLHHLQPPVAACPIIFDRFSPYFDEPAKHGITNLRPLPFYGEVLPDQAPLAKIAYHFEGDCPSAIAEQPELATKLAAAIVEWRKAYYAELPPRLQIVAAGDRYELIDTRFGQSGQREPITEELAATVLVPSNVRGSARTRYAWALERRLVVERDGKFVPLGTATPSVLEMFEQRYRNPSEALFTLAV